MAQPTKKSAEVQPTVADNTPVKEDSALSTPWPAVRAASASAPVRPGRYATLSGPLRTHQRRIHQNHAPVAVQPALWVPDSEAPTCASCNKIFHVINRRRHHCRACGNVVCNACSRSRVKLPHVGFSSPVRVCDRCLHQLLSQAQVRPLTRGGPPVPSSRTVSATSRLEPRGDPFTPIVPADADSMGSCLRKPKVAPGRLADAPVKPAKPTKPTSPVSASLPSEQLLPRQAQVFRKFLLTEADLDTAVMLCQHVHCTRADASCQSLSAILAGSAEAFELPATDSTDGTEVAVVGEELKRPHEACGDPDRSCEHGHLPYNLRRMLSRVIQQEVDSTQDPSTLFRSNTGGNRLLAHVGKLYGQSLLVASVAEPLRRMIQEEPGVEVNPAKLSARELVPGTDNEGEALLERNQQNLCVWAQLILDAMTTVKDQPCTGGAASSEVSLGDSGWSLPGALALSDICNIIADSVAARFPDHSEQVVAGFVFLRLFCPAIVNPTAATFPLLEPGTQITRDGRRSLMLVCKMIQACANDMPFGVKESFMVPMNPWVERNTPRLREFLSWLRGLGARPPVGSASVLLPDNLLALHTQQLWLELTHIAGLAQGPAHAVRPMSPLPADVEQRARACLSRAQAFANVHGVTLMEGVPDTRQHTQSGPRVTQRNYGSRAATLRPARNGNPPHVPPRIPYGRHRI